MKYRGDAKYMRKRIITIITYITIITFVGFLIIVSINKMKSVNKVSGKQDNHVIINYDHIYQEDNEEDTTGESSKGSTDNKTYILPNADKNKLLQIEPL